MKLHPPASFSGKTAVVTYQVYTDRGLVPESFTTDADGTLIPIPVAVLAHHFDRCYVRKLVRLHYNKPRWVLLEEGLDDPAAEPWLLMRALSNSVDMHFLVNGDFDMYPLAVKEPDHREGDQPEPPLSRLVLLPPELWKQGMDWTDFSAADRLTVEAAIQAFLHRHGLH